MKNEDDIPDSIKTSSSVRNPGNMKKPKVFFDNSMHKNIFPFHQPKDSSTPNTVSSSPDVSPSISSETLTDIESPKQSVSFEILQKIDNFIHENSEMLSVLEQDSKDLILIELFHSPFNNNWISPLYHTNQTRFKFTYRSFSNVNLIYHSTVLTTNHDSDKKFKIEIKKVLNFFYIKSLKKFPIFHRYQL
jgi:hypothetical protein